MDFGVNASMPDCKRPPLITIPPEIEAEMTPAVKAFVLSAFAQLKAWITELERQVREPDAAVN